MAAYYLDTSALVKRYAQERGTSWVRALTDSVRGHRLYTVRVTGPEMIAALFRKARNAEISLAAAGQAASDFRMDWQQQYRILEVRASVADRAMILAERHRLRGYDAVQLAAAMELQERRRTMQLQALTFVSADGEQLSAAQGDGLLVENPNSYP